MRTNNLQKIVKCGFTLQRKSYARQVQVAYDPDCFADTWTGVWARVRPSEIARWYLAAAHNAFRKKDSVLAEHYLKQSEAWDPNIKRDGDYWIAQLPKVGTGSIDELLDLVERAVMTDSRWTHRAAEDARILSEEFDFLHAVRALKIASLGQRPTTVKDLNELAYMRALAGIELDEALKDIDQAIAEGGPEPSLLDTKAWVLHGLKRNLEALGYMNEAIKGWEQDLAKARMTIPVPDATENQSEDQSEDLDSLDLSPVSPFSIRQLQADIKAARRRIGEAGYQLAVMRFHRMRILEALMHTSEAAADRTWLEERGVPVVDELF